jgi:hypothetical protein
MLLKAAMEIAQLIEQNSGKIQTPPWLLGFGNNHLSRHTKKQPSGYPRIWKIPIFKL